MHYDGNYVSMTVPLTERWRIAPYAALCLANAAEAVEVLSAGYVLSRVTSRSSERMLIAVGVYTGMLLGGLVSGVMSDTPGGRARVLRASLCLATLAAGLTAVTPGLATLISCRVLAGAGVGAATPALFSLAVELAPADRGSMAVALVASFWMVA